MVSTNNLFDLQSDLSMDQLQTVSGKLLHLVYKMNDNKLIGTRERGHLKDMVITNHKDLIAIYQQYLSEGTELTLTSAILHLVRADSKDNETESATSQDSKRIKRKPQSLLIPKRNIQKLPGMENRI